ncbi:MAG: ATP-binding protein [Naasia sp.]
MRELVGEIRAASAGRRTVVLVDGRSGAGKSTLATALARALEAQLVRLDDVYPGWDGLEAGASAVHTEIVPLSRWHRWSWDRQERSTTHDLDPRLPLVIEGCGALSRASRAQAVFGIWIDLDETERKARALARDGETYAPHWSRWAEQEERFAARECPRDLADRLVDGRRLTPPPQVPPA